MFLKCNNLRCRVDICKNMYITPCSHIFCLVCSTQIKRINHCIACRSFIKDNEIICNSLESIPCLLGLSPEEIFEVSQKALSFWIYQYEQEIVIAKTLQEKSENDLNTHKQEFMMLKNNFEIEKMNLKNKIKQLESKLDREKENNYDLSLMLADKTKQYQNALKNAERLKYRTNYKSVLEFDDEEKNL